MSRPNDFIYDPIFTVSSKQDFLKIAQKSNNAQQNFDYAPIFDNLFSEINKYPCKQIVIYQNDNQSVQSTLELWNQKVNRHTNKKYNVYKNQCFHVYRPLVKKENSIFIIKPEIQTPNEKIKIKRFRNILIQTDYRESSAQTCPWQPDPKVINGDTELLKLDFLTWNLNLPAGINEIFLIKRLRYKMLWEKIFDNLPNTLEGQKNRYKMIDELEIMEWKFREKQIKDYERMRMELLECLIKKNNDSRLKKSKSKLESLIALKTKHKQKEIEKIQQKYQRELRKLDLKYNQKSNITTNIKMPEKLFCPLLPAAIKSFKKYKRNSFNILNEDNNEIRNNRSLCVRETRWTEQALDDLHKTLKNLHMKKPKRVSFLQKKDKPKEPELEVESIEELEDESIVEEEEKQDVVEEKHDDSDDVDESEKYEDEEEFDENFECDENYECNENLECDEEVEEEEMYENELEEYEEENDDESDESGEYESTEEYKSWIYLVEDVTRASINIDHQKRNIVLNEDIEEEEEQEEQNFLSVLYRIQSKVAGQLFNFLNKELRRLLDERRVHAFLLIAEKERIEQQQQIDKIKLLRKRNDEIFKMFSKSCQDVGETYLQDILRDSIDSDQFSEKEMKRNILDFIKNIKQHNLLNDETKIKKIANELIHDYLFPQIENEIEKNKITLQQQRILEETFQINETKMEKSETESSIDSESSDYYHILSLLNTIMQSIN